MRKKFETLSRIAAAMKDLDTQQLDAPELRSKRLTFHLSEEEFEEIERAAEACEMSVARYLVALHRHAVQSILPDAWHHPRSSTTDLQDE